MDPNHVIDFTPILSQLLQLLGLLLVGAATWAAKKACDYFGLKQDDSARALIATAVQNGVKYAEGKLSTEVSKLDPQVTVSSPIVAEAANYVIGHVPDALTRLGVTQQQLSEKILAQLPK